MRSSSFPFAWALIILKQSDLDLIVIMLNAWSNLINYTTKFGAETPQNNGIMYFMCAYRITNTIRRGFLLFAFSFGISFFIIIELSRLIVSEFQKLMRFM